MTQEVKDEFYNEDQPEQNLDDVLSMELEDEKDIPVEIPENDYLLTQEEEKKLDQLLKKKAQSDFILQTFKKLEQRPSDEDIEKLKEKHGDVFLVSLSEKENFLFRALLRDEWKALMQRFEKAKLNEEQRTDGIAMAGVVFPALNQQNINKLTAGASNTLRNLILEASNFMEPERAVALVRKL